MHRIHHIVLVASLATACGMDDAGETFKGQPEVRLGQLRLGDAPPLENPPRKRFRSWWNRNVVSKWRPIGHMVHDVVEKVGDAQLIVGKFDYGVVHKDLEGEDIHAYVWGPSLSGWEYLGEARTNGDGKVSFNTWLGEGEYTVKMVVEGDLSSTHGFVSVMQPATAAVVFDIDGTLTADDIAVEDLFKSDYPSIAAMTIKPGADRLVSLYEAAGFQVFYLTARTYWLARPTRAWMQHNNMVENSLATTLSNDDALFPTSYKTSKLDDIQNAVGLSIFRVYGNATTDIDAYANAGIPKEDTFIIGEHAGEDGTQAINPDYVQHADWVEGELFSP